MGSFELRRHGACIAIGMIACLSVLEANATEFRQITFQTLVYENGIGSPDWSPDGSMLATTSWVLVTIW